MSIKRGSFITLAARVCQLGFSLLGTILIARVLGPSGKGAFALLTLTAAMLSMFGNLGFGLANTYFVASGKYSAKDLATNSLFVAAVIGSLAFIIFYLIFPFLQTSVLKGITANQLVLALATVPFLLLLMYFSSIILGQNKVILFNLVNATQWAFFFVLMIIFYSAGRLNVFTALLSWSLGTAASSFFAVAAVLRRDVLALRFDAKALKESFSFGAKGYLANLVTFFNYRLDMFLVNSFLSVTQVGLYSLAVSMGELLWYIPDSIGVVLFPRIPRTTKEESRALTTALCRHTLFVTVILGALSILVARFFVGWLLPSFIPALLPFYFLLPGIIALSLDKIVSSDLLGRGKPGYASIVALVTIVFTLILDILLIPAMGILGAALASTLVYALATLLMLNFFFRESKAGLGETLLIRKSDVLVYLDWLKSAKTSILRFKPEESA